jgi:hypothetical protein
MNDSDPERLVSLLQQLVNELPKTNHLPMSMSFKSVT